jgi:[FeFe] hydrogenase H-cluster maturation GTPase HydF
LVIDGSIGYTDEVIELKSELTRRGIPLIVAINKSDSIPERLPLSQDEIYVSAKSGEGIEELKERLGRLSKLKENKKTLVRDLITKADTVVLVTPIDESAPKGRLILPQQMVLRDVLDAHATAIVCQPDELGGIISSLKLPPRIVITDSQVFGAVAKIIPEDMPLTSFSILMARYKGELDGLISGVEVLKNLKDGDKVLISEGCTHHRQCNDIGTVKMPGWIKSFSGSEPEFHFTSGQDFPSDLSDFKIIVHCGGCMINEAEMKHRQARALEAGIPMINYGIAIAGMHGILDRAIKVF